MSLSARIRRIDAQLDWLIQRGPLRRCELDLAWLEMKEVVEARLKANPGNAKARRMGRMLGLKLPPVPKPPPPPVVRPPPVVTLPAPTPQPLPPVLVVAPPPEPPKPEPLPEPSYDIPEHLQIRPTRWRPRDGTDIDDWEDDGTHGQCLTEYDPLREYDEDDDDS